MTTKRSNDDHSSDDKSSSSKTNPLVIQSTSVTSGATMEDSALSATGQISATDANVGATLAWSVKSDARSNYGSLAIDNTGKWIYTLNNSSSAVQGLSAETAKKDSFTVRVTDSKGASAERLVTVTVSGSNDAPAITQNSLTIDGDSNSGKMKGTLLYTDADKGDEHTSTVALKPLIASAGTPDLSASLSQALRTSINDEGENGKGALKWDFALPSGAPKLAAGQAVLANYQLSITDNNGGNSAPQDLGILIVGTGGTPKIYSVAGSAGLSEQPGITGSNLPDQTTGVISGKNLGLEDKGALVSALVMSSWSSGSPIPSASANLLASALATSTVPTSRGGESHKSIAWQFSVPDKTFDFLGAGETLTLAYRVSSAKEHDGKSQVITITVTGTNDAPIITSNAAAAAGAVQEDMNQLVTGQLSASDVDHLATQAWSVQDNPVGAYGALAVDAASGKWTYSLDNTSTAVQALAAGETHNEIFTVRVTDDQGATADQTVAVAVTGTNDAPVAVADSGSQKNNEVKGYAVLTNDTDVDNGAVLTLAGASVAAGSGAVQVVGGQIRFDPGQDFNTLRLNETRVVDVNYTVSDEQGAQANSTLAVTVIGTNTPPQANPDSLTTDEDTPLQFGAAALLANDTDPDAGDTKSIVSVTAPTHGTLVDGGNGSYTYTPEPNYNGPDAFSYTMKDAAGEQSSAQVSLTVRPVNDAPVAVNDTNALTVTTLASQAHGNVVNWVDWTSATGGGNGTPGTIYGTINLGNGQTVGVTYSGEYFFAQTNSGTYFYTGTTGANGVYTSAAVANAPPSSDIIALNQQTQKTLTFTQPVDNLFFAVVSLNGMNNGVNNGYLFDHDFQIASSGAGYFGTGAATKVALPDGRFELLSTYNATPQLREFHGVVQIEGTVQSLTWTSLAAETWNGFTVGTYGKSLTATATGNVFANDSDPESDPITVASVNGAAIVGNSITLKLASTAEITVDKNGTYLYDENGAFGSLGQGQSTQDSFTYTLSDGHGGTSTPATVSITIKGVNDAPVANNDAATTNEDTPVTIPVLTNDTDVDNGDSKSLTSATGAQHGSLSINGSNVVYTPAANYNGSDSFTYTMQDAAGLTSTAAVNVTVTPVSDTYTPSNIVSNGSFETGATGWSLIADGVDVVSSSGWQSGDGTYSLDLNAFHPGGVSQVLSTIPGVQYTVGFDLSKNPGNATYATVHVSAAGSAQDYTFNSVNSATNMMWSQQTFTFTPTSTSTTLSFASTYPNDSTGGFPINAQGPALDEVVVVTNQSINNFTKGAGGDVIQLHDMLTSVSAPHDTTAFSGGYLRFLQSGSNTLVQIDSNGGGDAYLTVATVVGIALTQADNGNYAL